MASWSVHLTLELSVRFQVFCSCLRHFTLMLPLLPDVKMGTGEFNAGGNPAMD